MALIPLNAPAVTRGVSCTSGTLCLGSPISFSGSEIVGSAAPAAPVAELHILVTCVNSLLLFSSLLLANFSQRPIIVLLWAANTFFSLLSMPLVFPQTTSVSTSPVVSSDPQAAPEETVWRQCPKAPETAPDRGDNLILHQMNWAQCLSLSSPYAIVKDRGPLLTNHLCNRSL